MDVEERQQRGYEIAKQNQIKETKDGWLVQSQTSNTFYKVNQDFICDCLDSELHNTTCKHAYAVRYYLDIEKHKESGIETERIKLTYKQAWSAYNQAQTSEGTMFDELLRDLVYSIDDPMQMQGVGRPHLLVQDQLFVAIKKVYSQMSCRRSISLFGQAVEKGQITYKPHFNTITAFLNQNKTEAMLQKLVAVSAAPLKEVETEFAIDSTGFRTRCYGAYCEGKYPSKRQHKWIKLHASIGTKTHIITSVKILEEHSGDSPQLISLAQQVIDNGFTIHKVLADGAYSSRANLDYISKINATPYIPFKENSTGNSKGSLVWRRLYFYFKMNQDEFMANYHKRSNIESVFAAMKKKLGDSLKSKTQRAQVNELLCKVIAYNIMVLIAEIHELGINPNLAKTKGGGHDNN